MHFPSGLKEKPYCIECVGIENENIAFIVKCIGGMKSCVG